MANNPLESIQRQPDGRPDYNWYKGKWGSVDVDGLLVDVKVTDARNRYGHLDLLVSPVSGAGERWLEHHKVSIASAVEETPTIDKLEGVRALLSGSTIK
jgi:hypothetical protein